MRTLDASTLYSDDVRTLSSGPSCSKKAGIVEWNSHSDDQGTTNVKKENTPENTTNSPDNVATGALGLRSSAAMVRVGR